MLICFFCKGLMNLLVLSKEKVKKAKKHARVTLCKENIATLKAMQGGLNHVS